MITVNASQRQHTFPLHHRQEQAKDASFFYQHDK
jgi:hypothetical protein